METKKYTNVEELTKVADEQFIKYLNDNKLTDILKMVGKMPDHTVTNSVLIMHQMPNATFTKRLTDWDTFGRRVKEGQSSIRIISHCLKKYNQEETDEKGNIYAKGVDKLDISLGHVFDISQTVGREYQYLNTNKENIAAHFDAAKQALERTARGYKFSNIDLYKSDATRFVVDKENKALIPPFVALDGLGANVAMSVIEARKNGEFLSVEDIANRTQLNGTIIKNLQALGVIKLQEKNQLSLDLF